LFRNHVAKHKSWPHFNLKTPGSSNVGGFLAHSTHNGQLYGGNSFKYRASLRKTVAENAVVVKFWCVVSTYASLRRMHRLAQTGTVKVIVLRVAVDLVGAGAGCHWGFE
jgi:hypothetical protein